MMIQLLKMLVSCSISCMITHGSFQACMSKIGSQRQMKKIKQKKRTWHLFIYLFPFLNGRVGHIMHDRPFQRMSKAVLVPKSDLKKI